MFFACFGPQATINAGNEKGNICGSYLLEHWHLLGAGWALGGLDKVKIHDEFAHGSVWPFRLIQSLLWFICYPYCAVWLSLC